MKVKKYIVDSLPQALNEIKKDLGNDAIIIQTKKIKVGGFLKLFRKDKIEVIAAVDQRKIEPIKQKINTQYSDANYIENNSVGQYKSYNYGQGNNTTVPFIEKKTIPNVNQVEYTQNNIVNSKEDFINNNVSESLKSEVSELKNLILKMIMLKKYWNYMTK